jgi:hypothetical protein
MATQYPILKLPTENFDRGRSLCRLGFPFVEVTSTYDEANNSFAFANAQLVFFPNEGIFTRGRDAGRTPDGKHPVLFVETSSPGLRGQSGGPIFDADGRIWAIQSSTTHIALGFNPTITVNGRQTVEHQFINLGIGIHAATIVSVLDDLGVAYQVSAD